jgi:hypothetical protein
MLKPLSTVFSLLFLLCVLFPVTAQSAVPQSTLTVYYFHTTFRCHSCTLLEQYTRDAVLKNFPAEVKSGRIQFLVLNIEKEPNLHYVQDYQLSFKSVIVSVKDGTGREKRWENLSKVWVYLSDRDALEKYVVERIRSQLKEMPRA